MALRWLLGSAAVLATAVVVGGASGKDTAFPDITTPQALPTFVAPGPAFAASKARGKSVFIVPSHVGDIASMAAFTAGIRQAGAAANVKTTACANNGTLAAQTICLNRAIAARASVVILAGSIDLVSLEPALAAVKKAGIPMIASHVIAPGDYLGQGDFFTAGIVDFNVQRALTAYQTALSGLTATVPAPYAQAAKLMADFVTTTANGASVGVTIAGAGDLPQSISMVWAMQKELKSACGTPCSVTTIDVPWKSRLTDAVPTIKNAVLSRTTNYLLPVFDGIDGLALVANAEANSSRAGVVRPNFCSMGGTPQTIQHGQAAGNGPVVCDVGENMSWDGWATMDQALRVMTGVKPVASENLPVRLWTANNWFVSGMTFPPVIDAGWGDPGTTYRAGYRTLWGLNT